MKKIIKIINVWTLCLTLLTGCTAPLNTSSTVGVSSMESPSSSSLPVSSLPIFSLPVSSLPTSSAATSSMSAEEKWELNFNPGNWDHAKYQNVDVNADIRVLNGKKIQSISCGNRLTCLLTEEGEVYTIGLNMHKQLGQNTFQYLYGLQKVDLPEPIKLVTAGNYSVVAVGESNTIYAWGFLIYYNYRDHNGNELLDTRGSDIVTIPFDQEITQIQFKLAKVTFLTASGDAYAFGQAYSPYNTTEWTGMEGYDWSVDTVLVPQKIELPEKIVQVDATEGALFWLGESGTVYTAYNEFVVTFPTTPLDCNPYAGQLVFDRPVAQITAGLNALFLLLEDGTVWVAGANEPEYFAIADTQAENSAKNNLPYWVLDRVAQVQIKQKVKQIFTSPTQAVVYYFCEDGYVYATGEYECDSLLLGDQKSQADAATNDPPTYYVCNTPTRMQLPKMTEFYANGPTFYFRDAADHKIYTAGNMQFGTAIGASRPLVYTDGAQRTPVAVPLQFVDDFTLS